VNPTYDFSDQVALVTGAGAGMGLDTARAFAHAGAAVVLADVNRPGTIETPMVANMIAKGEFTVSDAEAGQPIGRLGRGEEIAAAALWLCSPARASSSASPYVDGGYTAR
jgi:NAD(P)-dependent dehydrogenase (short-subunit alcohol dehydrogenase family)